MNYDSHKIDYYLQPWEKKKSFSEKLKTWKMLTYNVKQQKQNKNYISGLLTGGHNGIPPASQRFCWSLNQCHWGNVLLSLDSPTEWGMGRLKTSGAEWVALRCTTLACRLFQLKIIKAQKAQEETDLLPYCLKEFKRLTPGRKLPSWDDYILIWARCDWQGEPRKAYLTKSPLCAIFKMTQYTFVY